MVKGKTTQQKVRKEALTKLAIIIAGLILIVNTVQLARFGAIVENVDMYNKGVVDELGGFREDVSSFGSDLNEIRSFLLLPTREYSFAKEFKPIVEEDEKETSNTEKAIYQFLGQFMDEQTVKENAAQAEEKVKSLYNNSSFREEISNYSLKVGRMETTDEMASFKILNETGVAIYSYIINKKDNSIIIQSALGTYEVEAEDAMEHDREIVDYFRKNKEDAEKMKTVIEKLTSDLSTLVKKWEIVKILNEKKVKIGAPEESNDEINYYVLNLEDEKLLMITIPRNDAKYILSDKEYETIEDLETALKEVLQEIDARTAFEKLIEDRQAELEEIFNSEAFQDYLSTNNLSISTEPSESYNKINYDVMDGDGKVAFSFVIELSSGMFKVMKDNEEIDLYTILNSGSKKKP